ncbi:hypothetical protein ABZ545_32540 [Streptomyces abikoensis]|uniref:hypothetical protein n=1 Tax=Streptomyces abikoensis TaxID=97398 RepID=UPI0033FDF324
MESRDGGEKSHAATALTYADGLAKACHLTEDRVSCRQYNRGQQLTMRKDGTGNAVAHS